MTPKPVAAVGYPEILIVDDKLPTSASWGRERRTLQLLADLRALQPEARLRFAATEANVRPLPMPWVEQLSVEVIGLQRDWRSWLAQHRFEFTLIILAGNASAHRLIEDLRGTQPQATVVGLLPWLTPLDVGSEKRFAVRDEQLGAQLARGLLRQRDSALVRRLDGVLCGNHDDLSRAADDAPGVTLFSYPTGVHGEGEPRPGFNDRAGVLSWGRFGIEPGDPDEEAAVQVDSSFRPLLLSSCPGTVLTVGLEKAPLGLSRFDTAGTTFREELRRAKVLVIARTFGIAANADALVLEAADAGTPTIAMDGSLSDSKSCTIAADIPDLARRTKQLTSDRAAWDEARRRVDVRWLRRSSGSLGELGRMMRTAGMASAGNTGVIAVPRHQAEQRVGIRTVQGQIQTAGFVEHRPTALPFARADIPQDQLWPAVAYECWYEAHRITERSLDEMRVRASTLPLRPLISIAMPVYNTDPDVLEQAFVSVLEQAYPFWELCAVDDGSDQVSTLEKLADLAKRDHRIRVTRSEENRGIAAASNAALAMASGEFIALLDHDDLLSPDALMEVVTLLNEEPDIDYLYSDEDKMDPSGKRTDPFFKPSWSPHLHLGVNFVTHFAVYRRRVLDMIGGFRDGYDGSQDYDMSLRATEVARRVAHIAKPIYTWRMVPGSAAAAHDAKPYALVAARRALGQALERRGIAGTIEQGLVPGTWRPRYAIHGDPLVSILIPTRNGRRLLEKCIDSIVERTTYRNFEFVIVDNGTDDPDTLEYLEGLKATVVRYPHRFNYARQMNLAVTAAKGDQVLFLNNDMEVIAPGWLEAMVELAQQDSVGAVGAHLLFPDGRAQHEGVFVGFGGGSAGNVDFGGYFELGRMIRDATAVTAACMLMRVEPFHKVGGFDDRLRVAFNDVDLCLRLRQQGYQIVYTPYASLLHVESASRGKLHPAEDEAFFIRRWGAPGEFRDPFYNPNLDPIRPFRLRR